MKQLALGVRLRADALFQSFAPGSNSEVLAALREPNATPLWLWGALGAGKTHLLQALCAATGARAAYFPVSRDAGLPPQALQGFESAPVLCIDDVDAVAGDAAWEQALFRIFNEVSEPRQATWVLEDWRSRAAACVVYQVRELDDAGRVEALRLRAAQRGLQLPDETSEYLLKRMPRDLPSLLRLLDELDEASLVAQRRLTIPFIRDALEKRAGTKS
jgi:DnaA family protein